MTTVHEIKQVVEANGSKFFTKDTMRFFGDKMSSFSVFEYKETIYLYRRPSAFVNAPFSGHVRAGRTFFNCWKFEENRLHSCPDDETTFIYEEILQR